MRKYLFWIILAHVLMGVLIVAQLDLDAGKKSTAKECKDGSNSKKVDLSVGKKTGFSKLTIEKCAYCHSIRCVIKYKNKVDDWADKVKEQLKKSGSPDYSSSQRKKIARELRKWAKD
jgi:hypothetical protein